MKYIVNWIMVSFYVLICPTLQAGTTLQVDIDGKKYSQSQKIILFSGYHEIIFHFPTNRKKGTNFQYRILEIENDWRVTSYPLARYTNLRGGVYHFELKYNIGQNQLIVVRKSFEIKEIFWEKWWFLLFLSVSAALGTSILIYFWFLYDLRQKTRTKAIRQTIAADLHDEVGANLSSISFLVESLKKSLNGQKEKFEPILDRISGNSRDTVTLINDTIWTLNPDYDNFGKLLERIKSFGSTILSCKDIAFSVENQLKNIEIELSIEDRRNLFFTMKEAINNIAKHSEASKVLLRIEEIEGRILVTIEDNGVGFDTVVLSDGNGLKNFKMRENIEVKVNSSIGSGTEVRINLNLKNH